MTTPAQPSLFPSTPSHLVIHSRAGYTSLSARLMAIARELSDIQCALENAPDGVLRAHAEGASPALSDAAIFLETASGRIHF